MKFPNALVDYVRSQGMRSEWVFEAARRLALALPVGRHHDFLPRFVGTALVGPNGLVYREQSGKAPVISLNYLKPTNREDRPFMPVEFAVAAYQFGHSIIRPFYVINQTTLERGGVPVFRTEPGFNLNGGRPIQPIWSSSGRTFSKSIQPSSTQAAQDRHKAVAAAVQPAELGRATAGSAAAAGAAQQPARQASWIAVGSAGGQDDARSGVVECTARAGKRTWLAGRGAVVVLHPEGSRTGGRQRGERLRDGRRADRRGSAGGPAAARQDLMLYLDPS